MLRHVRFKIVHHEIATSPFLDYIHCKFSPIESTGKPRLARGTLHGLPRYMHVIIMLPEIPIVSHFR